MNPITLSTFEQEVVQAAQPVLLDFYADWCGPCKMLHPILQEISRDRPAIKVVQVNVDQEAELARRHGVLSIPTVVLYQGGQIRANWVGLRSKQALLQDIDRLVVAS